MTRFLGHGLDAVTDSRNAKTPWAGTHGVDCVFTCCPAGFALDGQTSVTATPSRCMDGIDFPADILRQP